MIISKHFKKTNPLESDEETFDGSDASSDAPDGWRLEGCGTVGRVHSNTVNGRANDLSYIEIASIINILRKIIQYQPKYDTYTTDIRINLPKEKKEEHSKNRVLKLKTSEFQTSIMNKGN